MATVPAAVALWLAIALPAGAHAVLLETRPSDRSALEDAPETVVLRFDEPVEVAPSGVRVFDEDARRIDDGGPLDTGDPSRIEIPLPSDLPDGGYVVTWRVTSADSHPVAGAFTFTVGDVDAVDDELVARLFSGGDDPAVAAVGSVLRALSYLGVLVAAGAAAFAVTVARGAGDRERARRVALPAVLVGVAASLLALPVQAMAVTGSGLSGMLAAAGGLGVVLTSSFGHGTLVRLAGLLGLAVLWRRDRGVAWLVPAGGVAIASYLLDGHQRTAEPSWLLIAADAVHLAAAAVWVGGLVVLAATLRQRSLDADPAGGARLVARFSGLVLVAATAVTVAGGAMAWALVRVPRGLTGTGYGVLLLAKLTVVALVLFVAVYNRRRLVPSIVARVGGGGAVEGGTESPTTGRLERRSRAAWLQLRRTVTFEAAALSLVLLLTGFLVVQQPAADQLGVTGAYETSTPLGDDLEMQVVVDPNEVGRNAIHLWVLDATGRPAGDVEDLRMELTFLAEDIGPFTIEPFAAGPGHWIANVDELRFAGEWSLRVVAEVDRFEEASAQVTVPVNP